MIKISSPVTKKDHTEKMNGSAVYIADMPADNLLHGKMLRSEKAYAKIKAIRLPPLEEGYFVVDYRDVPGVNLLKVVSSEQPLFAEGQVCFAGEAILMIAGPDEKKVNQLVRQTKVEYEEQKPVLTMDEACENAAEYAYHKGDPDSAFKEAASVFEAVYETGYQEQAYIEPQGVIGVYEEGRATLYGSMQCPYYVKDAVMLCMGLGENAVRIVQTTTGGGFGGKEDYPSLIACQAAVAAKKTGKPVRLLFNRREDMAVTTKRHPSKIKYKCALDGANRLIALEADITLDAGAYCGLSSVVLQRSIIAACGVYDIPNIKVHGRAVLTHTVPNGAFRGFGAPQSFFAVESLMNHLSARLNLTPLEFKKQYMAKQGSSTSTSGCFHDPVKLPEMIEKAEELSGYSEKYALYRKQTGRFRKGIGLALFLHGCGFTGSGERDHIKSITRLFKREDDKVEILVSNTDMGQGLKTTLSKIVAEILNLPLDHVIMVNPDTDRVPNSGPTVASRSLMIVGKLLERAALKLKSSWKSGEALMIEERYRHPDLIPWDAQAFTGDAYPTYSWGVNVVEVELDTLTACTKVTGVWGVFDVGTAIDTTIMRGQMEGGMLQGLGYGSMEKMEQQNGVIRQASMTDYMIPTSMDTVPFKTALVENPYPDGPFGAKGAGELTLIGTAPAYAAAVEQASGRAIHFIPVTPERLMEVLHDTKL